MEWLVLLTLVVIIFIIVFLKIKSNFTNEIPKQIWTYWHSDDVPNFVRRCIKSWNKTNPDYKTNLLSKSNIKNYVEPPKGFDKLSPQKQSDWARLAVISKFGGVWFDASTVLTGPLGWINGYGKDTIVYYIDSNSPDKKYINIENWFIASTPQNSFINSWFNEFNYSVTKYGEKGHLHYEELKKKYGDDIADGAGTMTDAPDYYDQHISVQKIIKGDKVSMDSVQLLKAEDDPLYHGSHGGWKFIFQDSEKEYVPKIIKIIGHERNEINDQQNTITVHPNSIYKKYLE